MDAKNGAAANKGKKTVIPMKYLLIFGIFCVLVIIGVTIGAVLSDHSNENKLEKVATVNGYPITKREVEVRLKEGRGYIRNYFEKKYDVLKEDASFWDQQFDDTTPMEYGRKYYFDESVRMKMVQILAKKQGLIRDISYETFLERLEEENDRRSKAVANGQPIYGLLQYTETDYFENEFESLEEDLFEKLVEQGKFPVTDEEMRAYYDEYRDRRYKNTDNYTFEVVTSTISPSSEDGEDAVALAAIQAFEKRLKAGESFESLTKKVENGEFEGLTYSVVEVSPDTDSLELEKVSALLGEAKNLKKNEVSPLLTSKFYYYSIGRYTSFTDNGYADFESEAVKNNITYALQQDKFDEYIQQEIEKAKIEINEDLYNQIVIPEHLR